MSAFTAQRFTSGRFRAGVAGASVLLTAGLSACAPNVTGASTAGSGASGGPSAHMPRSLHEGDTGRNAQDLVAESAGDFEAFLATVVEDAAEYWRGQLTSWSASYGTEPWQPLYYSIVGNGEAVTSACSDGLGGYQVAGDPTELGEGASPAFFCPDDMTIYLSSPWLFTNIWSVPPSGSAVNDFGVAYAVAHEVAHAVQHDMGITDPPGSTTVAPTELQADCLAGVWSNAKYYQNVLEPGDIEEAVTTASTVGDYEFTEPGHHGTPEARTAAFMVGYDTGDSGACTLSLPGAL